MSYVPSKIRRYIEFRSHHAEAALLRAVACCRNPAPSGFALTELRVEPLRLKSSPSRGSSHGRPQSLNWVLAVDRLDVLCMID
jgi:hypothetical protein